MKIQAQPLPLPGVDAARPLDRAALREVAGEFESLLLQMMLKSMRAAMPEGGIFGNSRELKVYEELRDEQIAQQIGRQGALGLADVFEREFARGDAQNPSTALATARDAGQRITALKALDAMKEEIGHE